MAPKPKKHDVPFEQDPWQTIRGLSILGAFMPHFDGMRVARTTPADFHKYCKAFQPAFVSRPPVLALPS